MNAKFFVTAAAIAALAMDVSAQNAGSPNTGFNQGTTISPITPITPASPTDAGTTPNPGFGVQTGNIGQPPADVGQPPMNIGQPPMDIGQPPMDIGQPPMDIGDPTVGVGQPAGPGGPDFSEGMTVSPMTPVTPASPLTPGTSPSLGVPPPAVGNQTGIEPPGAAPLNNIIVIRTNGIGVVTNRFGTNGVLLPTSRTNSPNRIFLQ